MIRFKTGKGQYGEGDKFLGVKVPQTRAIVKAHWTVCSDADVDALITSPYHEVRLAGLLVLLRRYKDAKASEVEREKIVDEYLGYMDFINNWDLVDLTCYYLLAQGDENKDTFAGTIKSLDGFLDCYEGSKLKGMVAAPGIYEKGAIKGTKYLAQAYKLGLRVK